MNKNLHHNTREHMVLVDYLKIIVIRKQDILNLLLHVEGRLMSGITIFETANQFWCFSGKRITHLKITRSFKAYSYVVYPRVNKVCSTVGHTSEG